MILVSPILTGFLEANLDLNVVEVKMAPFLRKAEENKAPESRAAGPSPLLPVLFAPG